MAELLTIWNLLTVAAALAVYLATWFFAFQVLMSRRSAPATWAWLLSILLLPYFGALAYLLLGNDRLRRPRLLHRRRRLPAMRSRFEDKPHHTTKARLHPESQVDDDPLWDIPMPAAKRRMLREAARLGRVEPTIGNRVKLLPDGRSAFAALHEAIDAAREHVHLEFYIYHGDATGTELMERLVAACRRGVEVRLLVDDAGSFYTKPRFFEPLREAGGEVARFMPVSIVLAPHRANLRNHRKVVIVDGATGFTGGINVGDEYRGGQDATGRLWADVFCRIDGPAALDLQEVFIEDWLTATGHDLSVGDRYFPLAPIDPDAPDIVQIVASGPDEPHQEVHDILFAACLSAKQRAWLTTPYFVPSESLLSALKLAAIRGVDVRLLTPGRLTNHPMVFYAGRWYYRELIVAGVRIFEYQPGLLHAKLMSIDSEFGTIGSANMDIRSFRLNFELNALVVSVPFAQSVDTYFERHLIQAVEVTQETLDERGIPERALEGFCRLLSPVL